MNVATLMNDQKDQLSRPTLGHQLKVLTIPLQKATMDSSRDARKPQLMRDRGLAINRGTPAARPASPCRVRRSLIREADN